MVGRVNLMVQECQSNSYFRINEALKYHSCKVIDPLNALLNVSVSYELRIPYEEFFLSIVGRVLGIYELLLVILQSTKFLEKDESFS